MAEYKIIQTEDGSNTVLSSEFGETYHSVKGALSESLHVFIETGLKYILNRCGAVPENNNTIQLCNNETINILEIGFGTGLNAWLTLKEALRNKINIRYTSYEKYPIAKNMLSGFLPEKDPGFKWIHDIPWDIPCVFNNGDGINIGNNAGVFFELRKCNTDFITADFPDNEFHVIFMDAFSPEAHPEAWTELMFNRLFKSMKPGGVLTTYCAKGYVRRNMQNAGYIVERLPGPVNGKREILRALNSYFPHRQP